MKELINVKIPPFEMKITRSEVDKIPHKSGIYIFLNKYKKPLYVGQASDLKSRVFQHFTGRSNTSRYAGEFHTCCIFFEEEQYLKEIYEIYLINTLNTPFNVLKNFQSSRAIYQKEWVPAERCKGISGNGKKCRQHAMENGLCRHHGGKKSMDGKVSIGC